VSFLTSSVEERSDGALDSGVLVPKVRADANLDRSKALRFLSRLPLCKARLFGVRRSRLGQTAIVHDDPKPMGDAPDSELTDL
jgi:hypothetical protein